MRLVWEEEAVVVVVMTAQAQPLVADLEVFWVLHSMHKSLVAVVAKCQCRSMVA